MKKIVLYNPKPREDLEHHGVPLNLLKIASILDLEGYNIVIIDNFEKDKFEKLESEMKDALFLGITSLTGYTIKDGLDICKFVKSKYPNKPTVWGGWHPSILAEETLENEYIDVVVKGQGEITVFELAEAFRLGKNLSGILGISFKKGKKIIHNLIRPFEDVNNFPPVPYHLVDIEKYLVKTRYGARCLNYVSSQGCPHRCAFCSELKVFNRRWSGLTAKRVVDDFKYLVKKYKVDGIIIDDNNFFVDENRVVEICKGIIKNKIKLKLGAVNGRAKRLMLFKENTFELLQKAGLYNVLIGAESGSQEVLDFIEKDVNVEETIEAVKRCNKYGVIVTLSTIIGFPTKRMIQNHKEIDRQFRINLDLMDNLLSINRNNSAQMFIYNPYPGTPLYERSIQCGFKAPTSLEGWANFEFSNINIPWVPIKYQFLSHQFNMLYFPFMTNHIKNLILHHYGDWKYLFYPIYLIARTIILLRWRLKFFSFPIEYKILLLSFKIKNKIANSN